MFDVGPNEPNAFRALFGKIEVPNVWRKGISVDVFLTTMLADIPMRVAPLSAKYLFGRLVDIVLESIKSFCAPCEISEICPNQSLLVFRFQELSTSASPYEHLLCHYHQTE
jgi:hypothetical protein